MRRRHSLILVALLAAFAAAAEAQDTPDNLVSRCPECDELAGKARAARTRMQQADAVLKDASAARSKATADLIVLNLEVAAMRRIKPPLTNAQEARLNELQARRDAAEPAADAADARYTEASVAFVVALEQYANLSGELFACNKLCENPRETPLEDPGFNPPPIVTPNPPSIDTPDPPPVRAPVEIPPTPVPEPKCEPCEPPAEELKKVEAELTQARNEIEKLNVEIDSLQASVNQETRTINVTATRIGGDPKIKADIVKFAQERLQKYQRELDAKRKEKAEREQRVKELDDRSIQLRVKVLECNTACRIPTNRTWYLVGAGGGALGAILATTGGGSTTPTAVVTPPLVTATSPVATPQPQPAPPPQPAPQPPPMDPPATVAGVHDCVECAAIDDAGRHDLVIRFCDQAGGPWDVAVASITIRHAPPFVNIEGAQFDTASGVFRGVTRGTVAGFPNVGIAFEGTANAQTGRITFTYTMGTGGELPGGRPITYRITLQKRR